MRKSLHSFFLAGHYDFSIDWSFTPPPPVLTVPVGSVMVISFICGTILEVNLHFSVGDLFENNMVVITPSKSTYKKGMPAIQIWSFEKSFSCRNNSNIFCEVVLLTINVMEFSYGCYLARIQFVHGGIFSDKRLHFLAQNVRDFLRSITNKIPFVLAQKKYWNLPYLRFNSFCEPFWKSLHFHIPVSKNVKGVKVKC